MAPRQQANAIADEHMGVGTAHLVLVLVPLALRVRPLLREHCVEVCSASARLTELVFAPQGGCPRRGLCRADLIRHLLPLRVQQVLHGGHHSRPHPPNSSVWHAWHMP